jgi:hypothetical protein
MKYLVSDNHNYNYECWMDGEYAGVKITLKQAMKAQGGMQL